MKKAKAGELGISYEGTVTLKWKHLEDIARYYQFPSSVFLLPKMPKGMRNDNRLKRIIKLEKKIKELIEEELEK